MIEPGFPSGATIEVSSHATHRPQIKAWAIAARHFVLTSINDVEDTKLPDRRTGLTRSPETSADSA